MKPPIELSVREIAHAWAAASKKEPDVLLKKMVSDFWFGKFDDRFGISHFFEHSVKTEHFGVVTVHNSSAPKQTLNQQDVATYAPRALNKRGLRIEDGGVFEVTGNDGLRQRGELSHAFKDRKVIAGFLIAEAPLVAGCWDGSVAGIKKLGKLPFEKWKEPSTPPEMIDYFPNANFLRDEFEQWRIVRRRFSGWYDKSGLKPRINNFWPQGDRQEPAKSAPQFEEKIEQRLAEYLAESKAQSSSASASGFHKWTKKLRARDATLPIKYTRAACEKVFEDSGRGRGRGRPPLKERQ